MNIIVKQKKQKNAYVDCGNFKLIDKMPHCYKRKPLKRGFCFDIERDGDPFELSSDTTTVLIPHGSTIRFKGGDPDSLSSWAINYGIAVND